jgi:serine/threonine protein kinase
MVGQTIAHYRIVSQLGAGGMGVVYAAEDQRLGRPVALKFVPEDLARDRQAIDRLISEARTASGLNHANICTIYDIGEHEGRPFIVMELLKGQTLRERLVSGPLKIHEAIDLGIQVADALDSAHGRDIVHRDIKPANLFLLDRGQIKILDFGLAKFLSRRGGPSSSEHTTDMTAAGVTLGTVAYMSPEQVTGERLDGRSDLFSFGVVLYECVTGRQPFTGKTSAVVFSEILNRKPAAPVVFNPELPTRLQEIITTSLEKDRELRYQDAAGLRADLRRLKRDIESGESPRPVDLIAKQDRPRGLAIGAALVAVIAAALYWLWLGTRPPEIVQDVANPPPVAPAVREEAPVPPPPPRVEETVNSARALLAAGDINGATAALEAARAIDPKDSSVVELTRLVNQFKVQAETARRAAQQPQKPTAPPPPVAQPSQRQASKPPDPGPVPDPQPQRSQPPVSTAPVPPVSPPTTVPPVTTPPPVTSPATPAVVAPPPDAAPAPQPTPPAATEPTPRPSQPVPAPEPPVTRRESAPPPAAQPSEDDEAAIRRVVASYARAIETKDLGLFRSLKPNMSAAEQRRIEDGFRAVSTQHVNISILSIDRRDQRATVRVRRRDTIDANGREQTTESQQTMTLIRTSAGWVIGEIGR